MLMAISILAALRQRDRTGKGRRLQVAMQDAMVHYMRVPFSRTQLSGKAQLRGGSSRSSAMLAPSALYPCKPGGPNDYVYVFTSHANPEHWTRLLKKVIGREDLIGDPRYHTGPARGERAAEGSTRSSPRGPASTPRKGDEDHRRGRGAGRRGVRHARALERSLARTSAASCSGSSTRPPAS